MEFFIVSLFYLFQLYVGGNGVADDALIVILCEVIVLARVEHGLALLSHDGMLLFVHLAEDRLEL